MTSTWALGGVCSSGSWFLMLFFLSSRAHILEVETEVVEVEARLDKVTAEVLHRN